MKRALRSTIAAIAALAAALAATAGASAAGGAGAPTPLLPPPGSVLTGVSAGPPAPFAAEVGKHPAVYGEFVTWGQSIHFAFNDAAAAHAVPMLHISTSMGFGAKQRITPLGIAQGHGDRYLLFLGGLIRTYGKPVYIRLFPEMDNANNAYSAFNMDGSSRGASYSTRAFVAAWRRTVIVLRGGSVDAIDAQLRGLGQPPLSGPAADATITPPPVSFVWCPMVGGLPDVAGNGPADYWPGSGYVDWVGTDFYSKFPNFTGLEAFYKAFPGKPFAFGEWAIWGGDNPAFVDELFKWVGDHPRVRMMLYNQGYETDGPFRLNLDPASTAAIRARLASPRFLASAPAAI
jgi:hypothetical protein